MKCLVTIQLFTFLFFGSIAAIEISSKIDFESEDSTSSDFRDKEQPVVIIVENDNGAANKETGGFRGTASRPRSGGNVGIRGPVKPMIRSHGNYPLNPQPIRPKVTKNIYIVINGKAAAKPGNFDCSENVCEAILPTEIDDRGNVVDSVVLTVVTKTEDPKIEDVPVVDGIRGTGYETHRPDFTSSDDRASVGPPILNNNIPQASHRPGQMPRRRPFRPSVSFYPRNFVGPRPEVPVWKPWTPVRTPIDDKIEAPLSQTSDQ